MFQEINHLISVLDDSRCQDVGSNGVVVVVNVVEEGNVADQLQQGDRDANRVGKGHRRLLAHHLITRVGEKLKMNISLFVENYRLILAQSKLI